MLSTHHQLVNKPQNRIIVGTQSIRLKIGHSDAIAALLASTLAGDPRTQHLHSSGLHCIEKSDTLGLREGISEVILYWRASGDYGATGLNED